MVGLPAKFDKSSFSLETDQFLSYSQGQCMDRRTNSLADGTTEALLYLFCNALYEEKGNIWHIHNSAKG